MSLTFIEIPSIHNKKNIQLSYQTFGLPIGTAPVVLVNHALTGNSLVTGDLGWWTDLIGSNKTIDTNKYTIVAFNIPGNGYDNNPDNLIEDFELFTTKTVAQYFWDGLKQLQINSLYAIIGGSLGGAIAWEMSFIYPDKIQKLIPIATNYKVSDWLIANVFIQESILKNSKAPIQDARHHAMLLYRCPEGINQKFQGEFILENNQYKVENWLEYHGDALNARFKLPAYKLMNHLLKTIGVKFTVLDLEHWAIKYQGELHIISVNTDLMFTAHEQKQTYNQIKNKCKVRYSEIQSIHGHDAFLIEYNQISQFIKSHF